MKALSIILFTASASLVQANEFKIQCDFADRTIEIARTDLEGQIAISHSTCETSTIGIRTCGPSQSLVDFENATYQQDRSGLALFTNDIGYTAYLSVDHGNWAEEGSGRINLYVADECSGHYSDQLAKQCKTVRVK